jgi:hypothetical protein
VSWPPYWIPGPPQRIARNRFTVLATVVLLATGATAYAQRRGFGFGGGSGAPIASNLPYDGRFVFIRLRYGPPIPYQSQRYGWSHDYPDGEVHFMKILNEISYLNPHVEQSNVVGLGDPELFRYPVAYLCEPGGWYMTDEEAANLRQYLKKGGFLIIDDFRYQHWPNFEEQIRRVLPDARIDDLELSNPIFHAFFEIKTLDVPQYYDPPPAIFRAIYEDNDPGKRMLVMINYNTDVSEYWEWSDTGLKPIDESNEAYKLGVNYIVYGLTH